LSVDPLLKEIKQYRKSGYNTYRGWTQIEYQNKGYSIDQKAVDFERWQRGLCG